MNVLVQEPGTVTRLLLDWRAGKTDALDPLMSRVYADLHRISAHRLRMEMRRNQTLQPTDLLNEYFLRLHKSGEVDWQSRSHFFGFASRIMRQILVDQARERISLKRGGAYQKITLQADREVVPNQKDIEVLALDAALKELEDRDPRQAKVVELRFFAGMTIEETADALELAPATVKREWAVARAWLRRELRDERKDA